ncbi:hypothetical protein DFH07DRAFT_233472 [Mycena maculata]|uniref:Uncharacterized protein n=1 Tax=Mycena maculata TaxID=230809 RepID=A0AAD7HS63_9AGAR|nr:hypothetical protein DFH07DRAFT_233472 [Mycena maculata]
MRHCELFPSAITLTSELVVELRDMLIHNIGDAMTSPEHARKCRILSWWLRLCPGKTYVDFHISKSVYGCVPRRSLLIKIVSPLLFNAPLTHLRKFEVIYADELVSHAPWREMTAQLHLEWQELTYSPQSY